MTSDELKDLFRTDMSDAAEPFLWSDEEVYRYLDDAQKMFCRLTDGISDATTAAVTEIAVAAGATWLSLHKSILKIRAASRNSDGAALSTINYEDLARLGIRLDGRTGPLRTLITGMEENKLRLACAASLADKIKLLVFRLPLASIDGDGQCLEIGEQHHMHLLHWAKSRAYLKQDAETFDKAKSQEFEAWFRSYCAEAQKEQERKRHKGARTVGYGGI
jgi:hypothetical protein